MSAIATGLSTLDRLDRLAQQDTAVHRLDPRAKVLTTLVFIVCVASFGKYDVLQLLPYVIYPVVLSSIGGIPLGFLGRILLVVSPFALLVGIFNPFLDREVVAQIGGLEIAGGWVSYASIIVRFVLTAGMALVLTATTSWIGICLALEKLGVPDVLVTQLLLLFRYIFVLGDEVQRLGQARRLRSFGHHGMGLRVYGLMLGQLLLRSFARAQRVYQAMLCRGFDGRVRVARTLHFGRADLLFTLGWSALFVAFRLVDVPLLLGRLTTGLGQ